jgi:hypothetical protein
LRAFDARVELRQGVGDVGAKSWQANSPIGSRRHAHTLRLSSRRHRIARPFHSGGTSSLTTWFGTRSSSRRNHHNDSCVRIAPLSGIGVGNTTSYTDTRSDATKITSSPSA